MGLSRYVNALLGIDDVAVELLWRLGREHAPEQTGRTWELPATIASDLAIDWPQSYNWLPTDRWMRHLAFACRGVAAVERAAIPQDAYPEGIVVTHFRYQGRLHRVVVDFSDYMDRICGPALDGAACYFKMQYRRGGYGDARIVPGGYPVGSPYSYRFLSNLRRSSDTKPKLYNVYGRFGLRFAAEIRQKTVSLLSDAPDLGFVGGTHFVRNSRFLRDMARTKIGIDLPGNGDFCFRLIDYLSIGVCVIGPRPRTELPVPLVDGEHIIYCKEDLSDLVSLCRQYLGDDAGRERIARNAREYFDRYLHRDQLARYYVSTFLCALQSSQAGHSLPQNRSTCTETSKMTAP